ncbi:MAG TPA: rhodanese-like domain-containing protein [Acidobacteriota bacterium]
MLWVAVALGVVALALAWRASRRAAAAAGAAADAKLLADSASRSARDNAAELEAMRRALGVPAPGQKYLELSAAEALQWIQSNPGQGRVLDVRTPLEFEGGHVPGALHIPVDQIEQRCREVPSGSQRLFVVCMGGTRSAVACEILADKGYDNLVNIEDGMSAWRGPIEQGPIGQA